jgi:hypothetical protein
VPIRAVPFWLVVSVTLLAQAPKATDYAARTRLAGIEIGAKYLPQGVPRGSGIYLDRKYLVIDVGVFPEARKSLRVSKNQFTLSVDGKVALSAQTPGAGSSSGSLTASRDSSSSDSAVQLGGPPIPVPSSNKTQELESSMPRRPISLDPEESSASPPARKAALPESLTGKPVSGYLFFRFDGDPKSIRSLELTYTGPGGAKAKIRIP